ncbi:hypothetical protein SmJEL517_g05913 [Synchytrium microbalum]|uniref:Fe2OG dioxygenase domain-containing protein n=1 Tax=Synchytrium microbalum TaxID=1806994 RepID=A0A507BZ34_9FUNG|nr:uncharacterized protein SmJEL517_g05913 [Synchytrium microbalum]TPX30533.1 hypothetical protein SmJEL517_g05913 [Synchytrium microbalum]
MSENYSKDITFADAGDRVNFTEIPVLDYSLANGTPVQQQEFLKQLKFIVHNVGFMYLKNHPIPTPLVDKVKNYCENVFNLPMEKKLEIEMANSPTFLGYNRLGYEVTKGIQDMREQFDFAPDIPTLWKENAGMPDWRKLRGPGQWPSENYVPGFKANVSEYMNRMSKLSLEFTDLVGQSLGFGKGFLDWHFEEEVREGGRIKMIRYPPTKSSSDEQGVGPHKDGWLTFLLQVNDVDGLEVQNHSGDWIAVPPVDGTFVVNFGVGLERVTHGAIIATTHRVVNRAGAKKDRFSLPFFQSTAQTSTWDPLPIEKLPQELREAISSRQVVSDASATQFPTNLVGETMLMNRIRCHPDVGMRHYPHLLDGLLDPAHPAVKERAEEFKDKLDLPRASL